MWMDHVLLFCLWWTLGLLPPSRCCGQWRVRLPSSQKWNNWSRGSSVVNVLRNLHAVPKWLRVAFPPAVHEAPVSSCPRQRLCYGFGFWFLREATAATLSGVGCVTWSDLHALPMRELSTCHVPLAISPSSLGNVYSGPDGQYFHEKDNFSECVCYFQNISA